MEYLLQEEQSYEYSIFQCVKYTSNTTSISTWEFERDHRNPNVIFS